MSSPTPPSDGRRVRPIADFLAEHNRGVGAAQASEKLQELVTAVQETGKKGSITITVDVAPMKGGDNSVLVTTVKVGAKLPAVEPKPAVFYADDDGNLTRNDPNQLAFEGLREVPTPGPALRDAGPTAPTTATGGNQ